MRLKLFSLFSLCCFMVLMSSASFAEGRERGIYITQSTLENKQYLSYLIERAKSVGINTFIVDFERMSTAYRNNISLLKNNNIKYIARITMFPGGGTREQVRSEAYWRSKYQLVTNAISLGAEVIQLDYIRYKPTQSPSPQNAEDIYRVIQWFKSKLEAMHNIPLQIDVFGIASYHESPYIGQNLKLFANTVDAMCPMLYPSHFEPYQEHALHPYQTVYNSLLALRVQLNNQIPFKIYPYIELSNYHYWHPPFETLGYIYAQIRATQDGKADGWYAWSANNKYDHLFEVMKTYPIS